MQAPLQTARLSREASLGGCVVSEPARGCPPWVAGSPFDNGAKRMSNNKFQYSVGRSARNLPQETQT
eukprot:9495721-Pyramimonas_sp.AAC.1